MGNCRRRNHIQSHLGRLYIDMLPRKGSIPTYGVAMTLAGLWLRPVISNNLTVPNSRPIDALLYGVEGCQIALLLRLHIYRGVGFLL